MIQWFSIGWPAALPRIRVSTGAVLILLGCLSFGSAQAADTTPRQHAQGAYDAATGAYTVVKGDDLAAIAERFGVAAHELKSQNKLASGPIEVGQKLVIAASAPAGTPQITGVLGSPSATTTIPGNQLPPLPPPSSAA